MKPLFIYLVISFVSFPLYAQKGAPALKVYVSDMETGRNVATAKVSVEGENVKPVKGRYNKTGAYYYFREVPAGYNTVMVYHKKYNEKGFQDVNGLPRQISFALSTPYRVKVPGDTLNYYKEENDKILVGFSDTIHRIDLACPEYEKNGSCFAKKYFEEHYPELLFGGVVYEYPQPMYPYFYFTKKNKEKFNRFNDPVIGRLNADSNILGIYQFMLKTLVNQPKYRVNKTFFSTTGLPNYVPGHIKYMYYDTSNGKDQYPVFDPHKGSVDRLVMYRDMVKKGLINNNVRSLNSSELSEHYKLERNSLRQTGLYHYPIMNDTTISNFYFPEPVYDRGRIPYILVSSLLFNPEISFELYKPENPPVIYLRYKYMHAGGVSGFNKKIMQDIHLPRKIKYIFKGIVSPLGAMDIIECYQSKRMIYLPTICDFLRQSPGSH